MNTNDTRTGTPRSMATRWLEQLPVQGPAQLVLIRDFPWTDDYSWLRELTCANHPTARYLTKNPWDRGLHITEFPKGDDVERSASGECTCPMSDLAVVVTPGHQEERDIIARRIEMHVCDTSKHLSFQGTYGAPGMGSAWKCMICDAPWTQYGTVYYRADEGEGEPDNIATLNDVR